MLRFILIALSFGLLFTSLLACGEESPCIVQWRQYCTCCKTDAESSACLQYVEKAYIASTPTIPTETERKDCANKVKTFQCSKVPEISRNDFCKPK